MHHSNDFEDFEDLENLDFEVDLEGFDPESLSSGHRRRHMIQRMNRMLPKGRNRWFISKRRAQHQAHRTARRISQRTGRNIRVQHHVYSPLGLRHYHLSAPDGRALKLRFMYVEAVPAGRAQSLREAEGKSYQTQRQIFLRNLLNDPNQPRFVRGWIKQELNRLERIRRAQIAKTQLPGGSKRRIKGVKGYDVGHRIPGVHDHRRFRLEHVSTNRARPNYARRLGIKRFRESE